MAERLTSHCPLSNLFRAGGGDCSVIMEQYWIIGFGKVGRRALVRLRHKSPDADITIVDPRFSEPPEALQTAQWHAEDGLTFLINKNLNVRSEISPWIVPALPLHLAYEWIAVLLKESGPFKTCAVPDNVIPQLPNVVIGPAGQAYMSNADFICPENCNEPKKMCPVTGQPRSYRLYKHLSGVQPSGYRSLIIRSFQLAPGVGGYRGRHLIEVLTEIRANPGKYLLSTASKCHGVMHAFETQA